MNATKRYLKAVTVQSKRVSVRFAGSREQLSLRDEERCVFALSWLHVIRDATPTLTERKTAAASLQSQESACQDISMK